MANDTHYMTFFDHEWDGKMLNVPSLHITGLGDHPEYGQHLFELGDPCVTERIGHVFGHDFPRGLDMNKAIARSIRALVAKTL